jgi:hypothetical protein
MNDTFFAIRAIGAEFARRIYVPVAIAAAIVAVLLIALFTWLISIDPLWWLLAVPVFVFIFLVTVVLIAAKTLFKYIAPRITKQQKQEVATFVDKLQSVSEVAQTPKFILLFRIAKDVVAPKQTTFINTTVQNSMSLKKDFQTLKQSLSIK